MRRSHPPTPSASEPPGRSGRPSRTLDAAPPSDVDSAVAAYTRDLRVLLIAFLIATPAIVVLPTLFPGRESDTGQRLVDAIAFGLVVLVGLAISRRLVAAWDRRSARSAASRPRSPR